ncbi:MAG: polymerase sigma-32 factor [Candidatus Binatota bacterium]|nr:polymerase sigma-32 factor [Candidatus Binatota bacterium]
MPQGPDKEDWTEDEAAEPELALEDDGAAAAELPELPDLLPEPRADGALVPRDPLQRYLSEIRRYPLLTADEEHRLAVAYKEFGDVRAAYRLVTANLRLVVMVARRYERAFRNLLDLIQEGNIGLMEAVRKFDPYRGIRFPSYAVWWIRAYVIRYIMNNFRLVKMGTTQAQRKLFFNLQKEKQRLEGEGFDFSPKLIAHRLDVKPSEVVEMEQRMGSRDVSVDAPIGDAEDGSMLDLLPAAGGTTEETVADAHYKKQLTEKMREFGEHLEGKDRTIFEKRLLAEDPLTLQEIGEIYGISRERVRQIEERLKKRLREFLLQEMHDLNEVELMPTPKRKRRRGSVRAAKRPTTSPPANGS